MPKIRKQDFNEMVQESTYHGSRGGYTPKTVKRLLRNFWSENTGYALRGMDRRTALKNFRSLIGQAEEKGVRMRYSQVGGKLESSQKLKTRRVIYNKLKEIREEQNKPPEEAEEIPKEKLRAIHLRQRMEEMDEADEASGAKREALDTRKTATVSVFKTKSTPRPQASISQTETKEPLDLPID